MRAILIFVIKYRQILILFLSYFVIHLINLTLLPIFNDEAIYLDWAWQFTRNPGHLYDSLADSKQPLIIWIFGIFETFFHDPLFAGRLASVLIGALTLVGIYRITKYLLSEQIALISAGLYTVTPLFVFYNRQALMESAVMCIGIWIGYALIQVVRKPDTNSGIVLGILAGVGFFIKSSSLLFTLSASVVILFLFILNRQAKLLSAYVVSVITFFCVDLLLFINPLFWQTFHTNDRYSYSVKELFMFPVVAWIEHTVGIFAIGLVFLTPGIFLLGIAGLYVLYRKRQTGRVVLGYFLLALALEILTVRGQSLRYSVAFLPFMTIGAAYAFHALWTAQLWKKAIVVITCGIALFFTGMLLLSPETYILQTAKYSAYADTSYIFGQTSGYGIKEAMQYIQRHSNPKRATLVFFAWNVGNPENAIDIYTLKERNLYPLILDKRFIDNLVSYACLSSEFPVFFITRNNEMGGFEKYFTQLVAFPNLDTHYAIRIYTLTSPCNGPALSLPMLYKDRIQTLDTIR